MSELMLKHGIDASIKQAFAIQRMDDDFSLEL
jgi:hypothetical protein